MTIRFLSKVSRLQGSLDCCGGHLESGDGIGCRISLKHKLHSDGWGTGLGYGEINGSGNGLADNGWLEGNGAGSTDFYYTYDDGDGGFGL